MRSAGRTFLTGLITILPVVLTVYLLYWLGVSAESALGKLIRLLMHAYVVQRLFAKAEDVLYHVPLIKSVYRAIRDFFDFFSPGKEREFEKVVAVSLGNSGMQVVGFVTEARPERLPRDFGDEESLLVYLPLSYMIGGYTVLLPRSAVRPLDMTMEEAMRFTLTAGVTGVNASPAWSAHVSEASASPPA
jgi:uncharacterized membrane protein